jgi:hypothetical protein
MLDKFLKMALCSGGPGPVLLRRGSGRKGRQHLRDPSVSPIFLFFSLCLSSFCPLFLFFRLREGGEKGTMVRAKGYRGCARVTTNFLPRGIDSKAVGPSQL